jgi:hypothetical protein
MYNACDLNRWTACRMGPIISAASPSKNTLFFFCVNSPSLSVLQKEEGKEGKIKEKVEAAIHGFKEIGSLISKSKHNQQREILPQEHPTHLSITARRTRFLFQTWEFENFVLKKYTEFLTV